MIVLLDFRRFNDSDLRGEVFGELSADADIFIVFPDAVTVVVSGYKVRLREELLRFPNIVAIFNTVR